MQVTCPFVTGQKRRDPGLCSSPAITGPQYPGHSATPGNHAPGGWRVWFPLERRCVSSAPAFGAKRMACKRSSFRPSNAVAWRRRRRSQSTSPSEAQLGASQDPIEACVATSKWSGSSPTRCPFGIGGQRRETDGRRLCGPDRQMISSRRPRQVGLVRGGGLPARATRYTTPGQRREEAMRRVCIGGGCCARSGFFRLGPRS